MEKTTFGAGVEPAPELTAETRAEYFEKFIGWAQSLPLEDAQRVAEILQQIRGAHVPSA